MKKFTALFLALIMLFTCCISVFAANEEEENVKEKITRMAMERFDSRIKAWQISTSNKIEEEKTPANDYVTAEEAVERFAAELGYRPEYTVQQWYPTHWSLTVTFTHSPNEMKWDCEINNPSDDGWRMDVEDFEKLFEEMKPMFLTMPDEYTGDEKGYTTEEIEALFLEEYGYDVYVYACDYWSSDGVSVDYIVCDKYNGIDIEIDAVRCKDGWYVLESGWQWFLDNYDLKEETRYATKEVNYLTIEELEEEFEYLLKYVPEVSICEDDEALKTIEFYFDHLGGRMYHIDYVIEKEGELVVTEKVFEKFLEKHPAVAFVPKFTSLKQIQKMYEFYLERFMNE